MVACTVLTLGKLRQECRKLEGSLDYAVSSITILTTTTRPHLKIKRMVPIGFGGGDMVRAWEACNLCILGVVFLAAVTKKQMESSFQGLFQLTVPEDTVPHGREGTVVGELHHQVGTECPTT